MSEKKVYTANEIEEVKDEINLQVVLQELKKNIEEQLKKCGLYYRLFSRVKDSESLAQKLNGQKSAGASGHTSGPVLFGRSYSLPLYSGKNL